MVVQLDLGRKKEKADLQLTFIFYLMCKIRVPNQRHL
jgi:hypothetical protein